MTKIFNHTTNAFRSSLEEAREKYELMSQNIRLLCAHKIADGIFVGKAPFGYRFVRNGRKSTIILDTEEAKIIKQIFEYFATRDVSISSIAKTFSFAPSKVSRILSNPFYYGYMRSLCSIFPHKYQTIITKELFDKCCSKRRPIKERKSKFLLREFSI